MYIFSKRMIHFSGKECYFSSERGCLTCLLDSLLSQVFDRHTIRAYYVDCSWKEVGKRKDSWVFARIK